MQQYLESMTSFVVCRSRANSPHSEILPTAYCPMLKQRVFNNREVIFILWLTNLRPGSFRLNLKVHMKKVGIV
jgi:hypothetical protein